MDLSPAYREGLLRCPACGETMAAAPTETAEPFVCEACEGLWIDWFDGEVHAIAVEQEASRLERRASAPGPARITYPSATAGSGACPRCRRALTGELYRFPDASDDELVPGVDLLRCPECAGAFVPRGSAHLLLERLTEVRTQTPMAALRGLVRHMFGREPR